MKTQSKIIFHIDMDAFFASVEQASNPKLKSKPIAVIGSGKRTVITAASYEARAFGVKTGMTTYEAKKLCPHIILVAGNREKYIYICEEINKIYLQYTPFVEMYSIDESFLDMTHLLHKKISIINTAKEIKNKIKEKFKITCTIGIAPNKLLAKLLSDISKPDGLFYLREKHIEKFITPLPVEKLCGIGKKTSKYLSFLGIKTCGDLAKANIKTLKKYFGINGEKLSLMGKGIDSSKVNEFSHEEEPKSIGHSLTFEKDIYTKQDIEKNLLLLSEMVSKRMRRENYFGKTISLTVRFSDFSTVSKQKTFNEYLQITHEIFNKTKQIFYEKFKIKKPIRLFGISISNLKKGEYQKEFFKNIEKKLTLFKTIDYIDCKYGRQTILWASLLHDKKAHNRMIISPSFRISGSKKY